MPVGEDFDQALWVSAYGLKGSPFASRSPAFLPLGQREECLASLKHLALFSEKIILLTGESGSGKSMLLREWLSRQDGSLLLMVVPASQCADSQALARRLATEMGIPDVARLPTETLIPRLQEACGRRFENGLKTVLAVDDALLLDESVLLWLVQQLLPGVGGGLGLVLVGGNELPDRVRTLLPDLQDANRLAQLQLKPLSRSETRSYLESRLKAAGWSGEPALPDAMLQGLHEAAAGTFGGVEASAPRLLLGDRGAVVASASPVSRRLPHFRWWGLLLIPVVVAAGVGLALHAPWKSGETTDQADQAGPIPDESGPRVSVALPSPFTPEPGAPAEQERVGDAPEMSEAPEGRFDPAEVEPAVSDDWLSLNAEPPQPAVAAPPAESVESVEGSLAPALAPSSPEEVSTAAAAPAVMPPPSPPVTTAVVAPMAESSPPPRVAIERDLGWINAQSKRAWTVQLLGTVSEESARDYVAQWQGDDHQPFYFESVYQGKPWFVVLLGVFSGKEVARKAMEALPPSVRRQGPWLRSIASLQRAP